MFYLLIISSVVFVFGLVAMEIYKRRLNKKELVEFRQKTFQDQWWLYAVSFLLPVLGIFLQNVFALSAAVLIRLFCVFLLVWTIRVIMRVQKSNLPKGLIKTYVILSAIQLISGFAFFVSLVSFDATK